VTRPVQRTPIARRERRFPRGASFETGALLAQIESHQEEPA